MWGEAKLQQRSGQERVGSVQSPATPHSHNVAIAKQESLELGSPRCMYGHTQALHKMRDQVESHSLQWGVDGTQKGPMPRP